MSSQTEMPGDPVVLVFAGQGAQHSRMAAGLYGYDEVFTHWMDEAFRLHPRGETLREIWLDPIPDAEYDGAPIAQPLLYAVDHALGRMILSLDVTPVALLGHSVGEFAAATLAGVLSFEDGMRLMEDRMDHFSRAPGGSMLAVAASVEQVQELLDEGDVHLAAANGPRQLLLAGERSALDQAMDWLERRHITCRDIMCGTAFHSPVINEATAASLPAFRATTFRVPEIPIYSAYTRRRLDERQATDPDFWAWQPARTVYFGPTLDLLLRELDCFVLEAGPGNSLSLLARRHSRVRNGFSRTQALLPAHSAGDEADRRSVVDALDALGRSARPAPAGASRGGKHA